jgi:hypothetical protein
LAFAANRYCSWQLIGKSCIRSQRHAGLNPATTSKWQLAGATDMSAKHRALPETQQKLKDAGPNPATASKQAHGGKNGAGVPGATSTSQTIHKTSLRPMARKAAMMCISTAFVTKSALPMPRTLEPADGALLRDTKAR